MSAVDTALVEVIAALDAIAAPHEGLRDFARLNLQSEAQRAVRIAMEQFDRRLTRLKAAKDVLDALVADGFPGFPPREPLPAGALRDLRDNVGTLEQALAQLTGAPPAPAVALGLASGAREPKPLV